jgi:hypothetical protein
MCAQGRPCRHERRRLRCGNDSHPRFTHRACTRTRGEVDSHSEHSEHLPRSPQPSTTTPSSPSIADRNLQTPSAPTPDGADVWNAGIKGRPYEVLHRFIRLLYNLDVKVVYTVLRFLPATVTIKALNCNYDSKILQCQVSPHKWSSNM